MSLDAEAAKWWLLMGCAVLFLADALLLWKSQVYRDIYQRMYGEGWATSQLFFRTIFLGFFFAAVWFGWLD